MYNKIILNTFNNPKNPGRISKPDGIATMVNEDNSAHVEFSLRIDTNIIVDCKFRAQANPYIIAVCSTITEMVKGKMISMFFLDPYSIKSNLGVDDDVNINFCIECVRLAIEDYKENMNKSKKENKDEE